MSYKYSKKEKIIISLAIVALAYSLFQLSLVMADNLKHFNSISDIVKDCKDLSLEKSANCFTTDVSTFYKYNATHTYNQNNFSFERLKDTGGNCVDYSILFENLGKQEGFYTYKPVFQTTEKYAHEIAIIANKKGYCVIDQIDYHCIMFNKEQEEKWNIA